MNRLFKASVIDNKQVIQNHFLLRLKPASIISKPRPGNFFMLAVKSGLDPLLKRPLSLHYFDGQHLYFLYRVVGKGTDILSRSKAGDTLDIIGPLGNGFKTGSFSGRPALVAGGIGIAPIYALAESIIRKNPVLFYGARTKSELLCLDRLETLGIETVISTDDGTAGRKGNAVSTMKNHLSRNTSMVYGSAVFACGPEPMLKALSKLSVAKGLKTQMALEARMACGIGTCLGCVVDTVKGRKRVCKEGPVFKSEDILW